jgi:hypothetical protein
MTAEETEFSKSTSFTKSSFRTIYSVYKNIGEHVVLPITLEI